MCEHLNRRDTQGVASVRRYLVQNSSKLGTGCNVCPSDLRHTATTAFSHSGCKLECPDDSQKGAPVLRAYLALAAQVAGIWMLPTLIQFVRSLLQDRRYPGQDISLDNVMMTLRTRK